MGESVGPAYISRLVENTDVNVCKCKLMDQFETLDCITSILRQSWEELAPRERTPWH